MEKKVCKICNEELSLNKFQFRKDSNCYRGTCQKCQAKKRAPRDKNKMKIYYTRSNHKKRNNPEYRKYANDCKRKTIAKNPEKYRQLDKKKAKRRVNQMTDSYIVSILCGRKPELRDIYYKQKNLIELVRVNLKLKRKANDR